MSTDRTSITVRVPTTTSRRIDALVVAMNANAPGSATRTTVVCRLLSAALPAMERRMAERGVGDAE